jgi:DHA1 family bicyclomycin/chloramphenicol resistance-like MFS transporter
VPVIVPALLIAASSVSMLSTDMYAPSLPHLASILATDPAMVQLTMTLNVAGFALAQLVLGPLSDARGRRPVMLVGMAAFALVTLACGFAGSIETLIGARALQGVAASVEAVIALAIIRDLYDEAAAVRLLTIYGMVTPTAPAVGPLLGGHVHVHLGWRANFFILAALITTVALAMWRRLPETLPPGAPLPSLSPWSGNRRPHSPPPRP